MARRAAPYTIFRDPRTGNAWINAKVGGTRYRRPLGLAHHDARDPGHAQRLAEAAAQVYAALIQGRTLAPTKAERVQTSDTLDELLERWLADDAKTYPASPTTTVTHAAHFVRFATAPRDAADKRTPLQRLTDDVGPTEYARTRLRAVLKKTVTKEVTTLFRFYAWAKERGHLATLPARPAYPRKAVGVRVGRQRAKAVYVSHAELLRIIAALPVWTRRGGRGVNVVGQIPVRDLARFAYETGLRPSTIARLRVPEHYRAGAGRLWVTPQIDKGRNEARWVTLTSVAVEIIERHAARVEAGRPIFGKHDLRVQWKRAAARVLPPDRAQDFAPYDFRHGGARRMVQVSGGDLLGTAYQLGHRHVTTTNKYLDPAEAHGDAVVAAMEKASKAKRKAAR